MATRTLLYVTRGTVYPFAGYTITEGEVGFERMTEHVPRQADIGDVVQQEEIVNTPGCKSVLRLIQPGHAPAYESFPGAGEQF
jgi:hypothetical protein